MNPKQQLDREGVEVRRYEREDGHEFVADFGSVANASVDVVDDTVITVVDGEQYDVEIEGDASAFMTNGILTIEVKE